MLVGVLLKYKNSGRWNNIWKFAYKRLLGLLKSK